jgi:Arc/MetJ family transcription regulator
MEGSKFTTKGARVIAAQLYVAKGLKRNPAKMIKFMKINREYFPNISDEMLTLIQKEHNLTDDEIDKQTNVEFADLHAEREFEKDLLEKAMKIDQARKEEQRDHRGKGNATVYKSKTDTEEVEKAFSEMMKKD